MQHPHNSQHANQSDQSDEQEVLVDDRGHVRWLRP